MDLNHRPPGPEPGALARLRYAPTEHARPHQRLERNHNISIAPQHETRADSHAVVMAKQFQHSTEIATEKKPPQDFHLAAAQASTFSNLKLKIQSAA
jgi:hypothetical protein